MTAQPTLSAPTADRSRPVLALAVVAYVVRVIGPGWRSGFTPYFPDSFSYVTLARVGPFHSEFWWGDRPIGVPLALWLVGNNQRILLLAQTVAFAVSVAYLCAVVLRFFASRVIGWTTCALMWAIAVHPRFGLWHLEVLSESLGLTLSVLLFATWLQALNEPSRRRFLIAVGVTCAWIVVRDTHVVAAAVIAASLVVWALMGLRTHRRLRLIGASIVLACCTFTLVAQQGTHRNLAPIINNVGVRVLPSPGLTDFFVAHGMPMSRALLERTGDDSWSEDQSFGRDPRLESFRNWASARGQRVHALSLIAESSTWIDITSAATTNTLSLDFREYDRHGTYDRLPTRLFFFPGNDSMHDLVLWATAAAAAITVLAARRRTRPLAVGAFTITLACTLDLYVSAAGDSVEVQRHLIGSVFRLGLILPIITALGVHELFLLARRDKAASRVVREHAHTWSGSLALACGAVGVPAAWVALEHRSQDFDPQYARTIIERAARFGGTYYQNGIHNKGPLETVVYDSARLFTGYDSYWFAISAYVIIISVILGGVAWIVSRRSNMSTSLGIVSAVLVTAHFSISSSDYAGVLYSRNITTGLLALAFGLALWDRPWKRPHVASATYLLITCGISLAVQTMLPSVFSAGVIFAFVSMRRSRSTSLPHPLGTAIGVGIVSFVSAPVWYALRGSFAEFWSGWWTYAGFMSASTGRSLLNQIGLGATQFFGYYQQRPVIAVVLVCHVLFVRRLWSDLSTSRRSMHVILILWWLAGWVELVLSQRYSSHYFSVIAVPSAFISVATLALTLDIVRTRSRSPHLRPGVSTWSAILLVFACIAVQGTQLFWTGVEGVGSLRGIAQYVEARHDARSGNLRTEQAIMDLVSEDGDALLAWTMFPWTYLEHHRVPATRFSWKSFLIGEIYLGRTSPRYVLPSTWEWFAHDVDRTQPEVYARPTSIDLVQGNPFASYVDKTFTTVYSGGDLELGWRTDVWSRTLNAPTRRLDLGDSGPDSSWNPDSEHGTVSPTDRSTPWALPVQSCQRFSAVLERPSADVPTSIAFGFIDSTGDLVSIGTDFDRAWSMRADMETGSVSLNGTGRTLMHVTLLFTPRAAALVIGQQIVAAVELAGPSRVSLRVETGSLTIEGMRVADTSDLTGCRPVTP